MGRARITSWSCASLVMTVALAASAGAQSVSCPPSGAGGRLVFPDGSILMQTALAVNPDGAAASYTPGDHGYTYINNGVNLRDNGRKVSCVAVANQARCRREWALAEAGGFGPGTPEFCAFAIDVEPPAPGAQKTACEGAREGRFVVGNGKGRPQAGPQIPGVGGTFVSPYVSTTFLRHTRQGQSVYVDSATIPSLVVPISRPELVGSLAWVRYGEREAFAIVNDTGPAFGEGSVALHQLLQTGQIGPSQSVGPIPKALRCRSDEMGLKPPFSSSPDIRGDKCRRDHTPEGASDIRAYQGIDRNVTSIILAKVKPPMNGVLVTEEITPTELQDWAAAAGYSPDRLRQMASCLPH